MIVKFHPRGQGCGAGPTGYLLSDTDWKGEKRAVAPKVLSGDPDETCQLIDSLDFSQRYTSGVLNFKEETIPDAHKKEIMAEFEKCLFPDRSSEYNILWVEHTDKGRLELNFVIPNVDLADGKRLAPYYDKADRTRVDIFKRITNIKYGLASPDDPKLKQIFKRNSPCLYDSLDKFLEKANKDPESIGFWEARGAIEEQIAQNLINLNVKSRDDVLRALSGYDSIEVTRETKKSITIEYQFKGEAKKLRLKGGLYEQDFSGIKQDIDGNYRLQQEGGSPDSGELNKGLQGDQGVKQERNKSDARELEKLESKYSSHIEKKREYLESRHSKSKRERLEVERSLGDTSSNHAYPGDRSRERNNLDVQRSEPNDRQLRGSERRNEVLRLQERDNRKPDDLLRDITDDRTRETIKRNIAETVAICESSTQAIQAGSERLRAGSERLQRGRRAIGKLGITSQELARQPAPDLSKSGVGDRVIQQCRELIESVRKFFSREKQKPKQSMGLGGYGL